MSSSHVIYNVKRKMCRDVSNLQKSCSGSRRLVMEMVEEVQLSLENSPAAEDPFGSQEFHGKN